MRPIPPKMRQELASDPRMRQCSVWTPNARYGPCEGRIEWHHVWTYGGKQINEPWAIVGACHQHHEDVKKEPETRKAFERYSLGLATAADLMKYSRKGWDQIKKSIAYEA